MFSSEIKVPLLTILCCVALLFNHIHAETLFSLDNGLPNCTVNDFAKDSEGRLWIATENGLCAYDGAKFASYNAYKSTHGNSIVLRDNMVTKLLCDGNKMYVGYTNGLQIIDTELFRIENITFTKLTGDTIDVYVQSLAKDHNGDIIIGTLGNGVYKLQPGKHLASQHGFEKLSEDFITEITTGSDNKMYIGAVRRGLYILSPSGKNYDINLSNVVNELNISALQLIGDQLYIGSSSGLDIYDTQRHNYSHIPGSEKYAVTALLTYGDKALLVGTGASGMQTYDLIKKCFRDPLTLNTISTSRIKISAAYIGNGDRIWIGVAKRGLVYMPLSDNSFHYIGHHSSYNNVIGENAVTALCFTHDGKFLVATDNDRIYRLEHDIQADKWLSLGSYSFRTYVSTIFEDSRNVVWLGFTNKGLGKFDPTTGDINYISDFNNISVTGIMEDPNGGLWVSTMGYGLFRTDKDGKVVYKAPRTRGNLYTPAKNLLNNSWLTGTILGSGNNLYINSCYGMGCLNLQDSSFISRFGENRILEGIMVRYAYEAKDKTMWIGTSSGLYSLKPGSKDLTCYTMEDGLSSNTILGIVQDAKGDLWLSTNNGLTRMRSSDQTFLSYYKSDGLQGDEFMPKAITVDDAGRIYVGGINGITYFNPAEIPQERSELMLRITDFYVHNNPITPETESGGKRIIDTSLRDARVFHLSADDNTFSIEFTTNEFINSEHIHYSYSINGESWIDMPMGDYRLYFNKLPSGKYEIRVRAQYYNVVSSEKCIEVIVAPHWYATVLAYIIYVLLIAIGLTVFVILRRRRNKEKQLINEQLQKDRLNEALIKTLINIAHEIRTPLSLIISPLDRLSSMGDDERHNKMYVTMRHSANRILMLINQLLSLRKMEKGCFKLTFSETDIVEYIMDILPMFEVQFQEKDIKFHITKHIKSGQLCAYIDTNNFDKIIINLLSNAVKFTPKGGSISLDITENDNSYTISVKDSGIGLTKEDIAHLFERFYQATSSTAGVNVGTGIGLHFTHELVTLHHGSIAVENNADVPGTTFSVNMPLGREHLNDSEIVEDVTPAIKAEAIVPHEIDYLDPETVHNRRSYRIMVIDDDEDMLNYINYELSSDFKVTTFNNGKEAIKAIAEVNPDIIISDIMMPDFDGMALCRKLNNNINTNHIPVILLTADSSEEMQREALRNGADYYLTKPINFETLKCVVYRLIEQREKLKNIYKGHQETEVQSDIVKVTDYEEQFIKRVDEAIIKNIGNSEFSVEQLADAVGVGRVHLYRKIKSYSNQSPRDYIRNVRLKYAIEMLSNPKLNISEIAFSLGFASLQHFSTAFKETYGMSPKQYREKMEHA